MDMKEELQSGKRKLRRKFSCTEETYWDKTNPSLLFADCICMVLTEQCCLKQNITHYAVFPMPGLMAKKDYFFPIFLPTRWLKMSKTFDNKHFQWMACEPQKFLSSVGCRSIYDGLRSHSFARILGISQRDTLML